MENQQYYQPTPQSPAQSTMAVPTTRKGRVIRLDKRSALMLTLAVILILQIAIFGLGGYMLWNNRPPLRDQILAEAGRLAVINTLQVNNVIELKDVEQIRDANDIHKQVYANAQNGDYAIVNADGTMLIYRRSTNQIVYTGDAPNTILSKNQQQIVAGIMNVLKDKGAIAKDNTETPVVSVVDNPEQLIQRNREIFANAQKGDYIIEFQQSRKLFVFRPSTQTIVKQAEIEYTFK
jgi:hypothetical protein